MQQPQQQPPPYYPNVQNPMPPLPPLPGKDESDLRLLSILEYVYAGFMGFTGLLCGVYIAVGAMIANAPLPPPSHPGAAPPPPIAMESIGAFVMIVGVVAMIIAWTKCVLLIVSGRSMSARKRHTLCVVVAAFTCISFPLGTALGVFTLIVLLRPSVRAMFS